MAAEIKLVYFDLRGRAEPIRMVLAAANKKYEDVRVPFDQWPAEKPNTPYGQLPYIIYNDKKYGQSTALAAFFAREYGLYGETNLEALRIDEVLGLCKDVSDAAMKVKFEKDKAKKAELGQKLKEETVPKTLGFFCRLLKDNGDSGFFVGTNVSLAEIFAYTTLDFLMEEKVANDLPPEVTKMRSRVEEHQYLKVYLANRKPSSI